MGMGKSIGMSHGHIPESVDTMEKLEAWQREEQGMSEAIGMMWLLVFFALGVGAIAGLLIVLMG